MKKFTIPGKPTPLARPRVTQYGAYDSQKDEKIVHRSILRRQRGTTTLPPDTPIEMSITFFMPIPKTMPKKKREELKYHYKRPDLDNLIKWVLDVAQGVLFEDDSRVCVMHSKKKYDKDPRTEFTIKEIK